MEETAVVPSPTTPADALVPHFKRCGYGDTQIAVPFRVDQVTIDVATFAGKPWDNWSACLAAVNLNGDSIASAMKASTLGAASVFVCGPLGIDWYGLGPNGPFSPRPIKWADVGGVFREYKDELAPSRIYDAKLCRPNAKPTQMWFFDAGLMPAVEKNRGHTLARIVESVISGLADELGARLNSRQAQEDVYRTVFWLLAAKILQDKEVHNFVRLNLRNVDDVFDRIGGHHGETGRFPPFGASGRPAIDAAANAIASSGSFADVASESLAYVYENALIDKAAGSSRRSRSSERYDIRKELGIHSTPTVLVNHMLSQLWPLIEQLPEDDRHVFEPACGHAPFLTGAMRWLRTWGKAEDADSQHRYLKRHLHGVEKDPFAIEIAKLRLLLADAPHGNRWDISEGDMFDGSVLADRASDARVLLANPPYERTNFKVAKAAKKSSGTTRSRRKVDEVLARALPKLQAGSVIGVVVPQGFLRSAEARALRRTLLDEWSLTEIAIFEDRLFEHPDQETAILLGHRVAPAHARATLVYRRVRNIGMAAFKERLAFSQETRVPLSRFSSAESCSLELPELEAIWNHLRDCPKLGEVVNIAKGLEVDEASIGKTSSIEVAKSKPGYEEVVRRAEGHYGIHELPATTWIDFRRARVRRAGPDPRSGVKQVLVNYAPAGRDRWRLRALLDTKGRIATRRFLVARPKQKAPPLLFLWAVLNSPIGNAFVASHCGKQDIPKRVMQRMPLPIADAQQITRVCQLADDYIRAVRAPSAAPLYGHSPPDPHAALLRLDAEVLRLYDLPPKLERELLDYFRGEKRKGVPFPFGDYYPSGMDAFVPLHELISAEYARSTLGRFRDHHKPTSDPKFLAALQTAAEAFSEE